MTAPRLKDPRVRRGQYVRMNIPVASLAAADMAIQVVPPAPAGFANVVTRVTAVMNALTAAISGVGADDNLVIRATDDSGAVLSNAVTGVGFLDASAGTSVCAIASPAALQVPVAAAALVLAYTADADGVTIGSAAGNLQLDVEFDIVSVAG